MRTNSSLLWVYYHLNLAFVHFIKSTRKSWHGSDPPPFWQCKDFGSASYCNPSLNLPNENLLICYKSIYQVDIINQLLETLHDIHGFSYLGTVKKAIKIHQKCIFQPLHNEVKSVLGIKESYSMEKSRKSVFKKFTS